MGSRSLHVGGALALLVIAAGCGDHAGDAGSDEGAGETRVPLETQLATLAELGLARNTGVEEADLFPFHTREEMEARPYRLLVEAMALEIEREPWTPITDRLWLLDLERIEDDGDYASVLLRLERMTGKALRLTAIRDEVDLEHGVAWVSFVQGRETVRWNLQVEDDWLDPEVLARYDERLAAAGSPRRLWVASDAEDYGQSALLAALTPEEHEALVELTGIDLVPVE